MFMVFAVQYVFNVDFIAIANDTHLTALAFGCSQYSRKMKTQLDLEVLQLPLYNEMK